MALKIQKQIKINASSQKVWDALFQDATYRQWTSVFMEGSFAETDWKKGSEVRFLTPNRDGMLGFIAENQPNQLMVIEYSGIVNKGVDDTQSEAASAVKGGQEIYRLSSDGSQTTLDIESDMSPEYYDEMEKAWDKALPIVKKLAEE